MWQVLSSMSNPVRLWAPPPKPWDTEGCSEQSDYHFVAGRHQCLLLWIYLKTCTHLWGLYDLPLWTEEAVTIWLFSFFPSPSYIHIAIGANLEASVKGLVRSSSYITCFSFSSSPCKAILALSQVCHSAFNIINPDGQNHKSNTRLSNAVS